jgi:hypothetical protein
LLKIIPLGDPWVLLPPSSPRGRGVVQAAHDAVCEIFFGKFFWFKKEAPISYFFFLGIF